MRILIPLAVLSSNAFAQPVTGAERAKVLQEMQTCMRDQVKREAVGDTQFRRGKFAEAVTEYEASLYCPGTVPRPHDRAKVALAACKAGDATMARKHYDKLSYAHRRGLDGVCGKHKITLRPAAPTTPPAKLDVDMIGETLEPALRDLKLCVMQSIKNPRTGYTVTVTGHVEASGSVARVDVPGSVPWAQCVRTIVGSQQFPATSGGSDFSYKFFSDPSVIHPERAIAHAERWFTEGQHAKAIQQWRWVLDGGPSPAHFERAMEMACTAKLDADATLFFWQLDAKQRTTIAQMCAKHGVTFP